MILHQKLLLQSNAMNIIKSVSTHAVLIIGDDIVAVKGLATLCNAYIMCQSKDRPCMCCDSCRLTSANKHFDSIVVDKERLGVPDISVVLDNILLAPIGHTRTVVLHNLESATVAAQNKLLKVLEEPPRNARFVLSASSKVGVLPTVVSRCTVVQVQPFLYSDIYKSMCGTVPDEKLQLAISLSEGKLYKVHRMVDDSNYSDCAELALQSLKKLRASTDIAQVSRLLIDNADNLLIIIECMQLIFRDIVAYLNKVQGVALSSVFYKDIVEISPRYSSSAAINILMSLVDIVRRIKQNGSTTSVIDNLLFVLLEHKHSCRAEIS